MNSQENPDNERRLQKLEMEINQDQIRTVQTQTEQPSPENSNFAFLLPSGLNQVANWFNSLPNPGKVVVAIIATLIGFSILKTVLQLVASLISLALLGVILYLGYKFFIAPGSSK
jgi:hypothetical protein